MEWTGHVEDPDHRALRRAGRTSLVLTVSFLVGAEAVGNRQVATVAAFTSVALLGVADFGGERRARLAATAATLAVGAALVALGTAVSSDTASATVAMFVVTFLVAYTAVFNGYFAVAVTPVVMIFVVATGLPGSLSTLPAREAGLALGGGLSLLALGWLWPSRAAAASRQALGRVLAALASGFREVAGARGAAGAPAPVDDLVLEAERAIASSAWRPDGLSSPHRARMYLLEGSRRMAGLLRRLRADAMVPALADEPPATALLEVLASELDRSAGALVGSGPLPDPAAAEAATGAYAAGTRSVDAEAVRRRAPATVLVARAARAFRLQQLGWGVALTAAHCRVAFGGRVDASPALGRSLLVGQLAGPSTPGTWLRRARRNLTLRSVHLQNSLRLATGLAVARLLVGLFDLQHGFWVCFATLVVLKTSAAGTRATAIQAAVGTAVGFGLSTALVATVGVDLPLYAVALPIVALGAFYLPGTVSFVAGQACFTMLVVFLFNLLKPVGWTVGLVRLEDVVVGAAVGLAIGLALWPRGAAPELRQVLARLYAAAAACVEAAVGTALAAVPGRGADGVDLDATHRRATAASVDAEDVFSQYLAEPHQPDAPVLAWSTLVSGAHQVWFGAGVTALLPTAPPDADPDLTDHVTEAAAAVGATYRGLADALRAGRPFRAPTLEPAAVVTSPDRPEAGFDLLELEAWLVALAELAGGLAPALTAVAEPSRSGTVR